MITDFGEGYYAGAVKGTILDVCSDARIVDITHACTSHDIQEAAFTLLCTYPYYPSDTIHMVVVDPGVGSARRGIIVSTDKHRFVGPDNGVFSFVYARERVQEIVSIDSQKYLFPTVSPTFHGRDIFAPVAAWLAQGTSLKEFGSPVTDYTRMDFSMVQKSGENLLSGSVIHVDKFGNVITNLSPKETFQLLGTRGTPHFVIKGREIKTHYSFYAEADSGELFSLVGSSGYYEIAAQKRAAAEILKVSRGEPVELKLQEAMHDPG